MPASLHPWRHVGRRRARPRQQADRPHRAGRVPCATSGASGCVGARGSAASLGCACWSDGGGGLGVRCFRSRPAAARGEGTTWQVGDVVLKPAADPQGASWCAELFAGLEGPGFRVPRPRRTVAGAWLADGWAAWERVEGEPGPVEHWPGLIAASRAFHAALADVPHPGWLRGRRDRWAVADRIAWGEASVVVAPGLQGLVDDLVAARAPVELPSQLVHGDLAGNVLFAGRLRR